MFIHFDNITVVKSFIEDLATELNTQLGGESRFYPWAAGHPIENIPDDTWVAITEGDMINANNYETL